MDSIPMVAITGQVGAQLIGTDAFQEADIVGATMPVTKHSFLVTSADEIPARIAEAFYIASTGRPGPVLVDVTKSAQTEEADFVWPPVMDLPGYRPTTKPNARQVREAARLLTKASRPVLYLPVTFRRMANITAVFAEQAFCGASAFQFVAIHHL